jgi:hypothetical protein
MAATPAKAPFRVRYGGGEWYEVDLAPGASPADVKEAVAGQVNLAVGTFTIRSAATQATSTFHAGLVGDWDVVLLPGQAPPAAAAPAPGE